jgi:hypothetical protein
MLSDHIMLWDVLTLWAKPERTAIHYRTSARLGRANGWFIVYTSFSFIVLVPVIALGGKDLLTATKSFP